MNLTPLLAAIFPLFACGPMESECVITTRCGLCIAGRVPQMDLPPAWSHEAVQKVEDVLLEELQQTKDPRLTDSTVACKALSTYTATIHNSDYWMDRYGRSIAGVTYCSRWLLQVNNEAPWKGSLAHEMVHAMQNCTAEGDGADGHQNWVSADIFDAIDRAFGRSYSGPMDVGVK